MSFEKLRGIFSPDYWQYCGDFLAPTPASLFSGQWPFSWAGDLWDMKSYVVVPPQKKGWETLGCTDGLSNMSLHNASQITTSSWPAAQKLPWKLTVCNRLQRNAVDRLKYELLQWRYGKISWNDVKRWYKGQKIAVSETACLQHTQKIITWQLKQKRRNQKA